jgi:hypothetical protein
MKRKIARKTVQSEVKRLLKAYPEYRSGRKSGLKLVWHYWMDELHPLGKNIMDATKADDDLVKHLVQIANFEIQVSFSQFIFSCQPAESILRARREIQKKHPSLRK